MNWPTNPDAHIFPMDASAGELYDRMPPAGAQVLRNVLAYYAPQLEKATRGDQDLERQVGSIFVHAGLGIVDSRATER